MGIHTIATYAKIGQTLIARCTAGRAMHLDEDYGGKCVPI